MLAVEAPSLQLRSVLAAAGSDQSRCVCVCVCVAARTSTGERGGRPRVSDSLTTPIVQTSTYHFKDTEELIAYQEGRFGSFEYGRYGNPTSRVVEEKLRCAPAHPSPRLCARSS